MPLARPPIALVAAAALLLGGCSPVPAGTPAGPSASAAVSPEFNAADVTFVRALIPHHRQGVAIAELGAERASRPEARMLAGAIVATQQDEITRMEGWLAAWNQARVPAAAADTRVAELAKVPAEDFDATFAGLLNAHQGEAVRLARAETGAGANRDALTFARQVDESRTAQIAQMADYSR